MLEDAIFNKVTVNYVEFKVRNILRSKTFYTHLGWSFVDFDEHYCEFDSGGFKGGFAQVETVDSSGGALLVLYTEQLEHSLDVVNLAGGHIIQPIFAFPGGRRFHFRDPDGYELAIWSDH
jgi:predicted enzyme related to lactoylglutathione lyase